MDEELQLTPDQRTKVTAVYQDEANRMIAINTKYAGTDGATTQRRAKLSEMRAVNQDTQDKLAKLLTAKQATQWNEFVQERRERNRKTLRHDVPHPAAPGGTSPGGAPATGAAK
jgi:Spy/CpxP family protein refolding chaperone